MVILSMLNLYFFQKTDAYRCSAVIDPNLLVFIFKSFNLKKSYLLPILKQIAFYFFKLRIYCHETKHTASGYRANTA